LAAIGRLLQTIDTSSSETPMTAAPAPPDHPPGTMHYWADNPFRPVCWRWLQGATLAAKKRIEPAHGDCWVVLAREYQLSLKYPDGDRLEGLDKWTSHVAAAREIWANDGSIRKAIIEAALLAQENCETVGRRFGLEGKTIQAYEKLFFSVEEKLPQTDYVIQHAIGPKIHGRLTIEDFPLLLKLYAYNCGPRVLDAMLGLYGTEIRPDLAAELGTFEAVDASDRFWLKACLAATMLDVTSRNAFEVLKLWLHFRQLERDVDHNGSFSDTLAENIDAVLAEYRLTFKIEPPPAVATVAA
jgi:hypothetical protein